jgi:hypothetical protein
MKVLHNHLYQICLERSKTDYIPGCLFVRLAFSLPLSVAPDRGHLPPLDVFKPVLIIHEFGCKIFTYVIIK